MHATMPSFTWVLGIPTHISHLCGKHFTLLSHLPIWNINYLKCPSQDLRGFIWQSKLPLWLVHLEQYRWDCLPFTTLKELLFLRNITSASRNGTMWVYSIRPWQHSGQSTWRVSRKGRKEKKEGRREGREGGREGGRRRKEGKKERKKVSFEPALGPPHSVLKHCSP